MARLVFAFVIGLLLTQRRMPRTQNLSQPRSWPATPSTAAPSLGTGSFYFGTFHDHGGKPLEGGSNYRLHVPAEVPVREFWSATAIV